MRKGEMKRNDKIGREVETEEREDEGQIEMRKWRKEMEEWKRMWERKKWDIIKIERKRFSQTRDYQGEWDDGKRNGLGITFWVSGERTGNSHEGEYEEGTANGKGICNYVNGDRYEGEFRGGYRSGKGTYFWKNGNWEEGEQE